jgi:hypothetical protein
MPCNAGFECREGACAPVQPEPPKGLCTDTDGKGTTVKGIVNASGSIYFDSCEDLKRVKEHYCLDGEERNEAIECPSGYRCLDGRCSKSDQTCTDTDGGNDIYRAGTLVATAGLVSGEYLDKCLDGHMLREYFCDGTEKGVVDIECPAGMVCVTAECRTPG